MRRLRLRLGSSAERPPFSKSHARTSSLPVDLEVVDISREQDPALRLAIPPLLEDSQESSPQDPDKLVPKVRYIYRRPLLPLLTESIISVKVVGASVPPSLTAVDVKTRIVGDSDSDLGVPLNSTQHPATNEITTNADAPPSIELAGGSLSEPGAFFASSALKIYMYLSVMHQIPLWGKWRLLRACLLLTSNLQEQLWTRRAQCRQLNLG